MKRDECRVMSDGGRVANVESETRRAPPNWGLAAAITIEGEFFTCPSVITSFKLR
jgi:hypothetical protein